MINDKPTPQEEKHSINRKLSNDFEKLEKITDKWGFLRQLYMENISDILEVSSKNILLWANVYYLNWRGHLSPIEHIAWNSIRDLGHVVLYPQFPLFNYFIDFANPYLKIGLEIDGKDFHDVEKDTKRDNLLLDYGWRIFRVTGKEAHHEYFNIEEIDEKQLVDQDKLNEVENWFLNTIDGVINAIRYWYFFDNQKRENYYTFPLNENRPESEMDFIDIHSLAKRTLKKHKLADFII